MLTSNQFEVNGAWVVVKANHAPLFVKDDPYDVYVMMDAASTFVLGHALSKAPDGAPEAEEVRAFFRTGWATRRQWPHRVILSGKSPAEDVFRQVAEQHGIAIEYVPPSELVLLVKVVRDSFSSAFR